MRVPNLKPEEDHVADECPVCRSRDLHPEQVHAGTPTASQRVSCDHCGSMWLTTYRIEGYDLLHLGSEVEVEEPLTGTP